MEFNLSKKILSKKIGLCLKRHGFESIFLSFPMLGDHFYIDRLNGYSLEIGLDKKQKKINQNLKSFADTPYESFLFDTKKKNEDICVFLEELRSIVVDFIFGDCKVQNSKDILIIKTIDYLGEDVEELASFVLKDVKYFTVNI